MGLHYLYLFIVYTIENVCVCIVNETINTYYSKIKLWLNINTNYTRLIKKGGKFKILYII